PQPAKRRRKFVSALPNAPLLHGSCFVKPQRGQNTPPRRRQARDSTAGRNTPVEFLQAAQIAQPRCRAKLPARGFPILSRRESRTSPVRLRSLSEFLPSRLRRRSRDLSCAA